MQRKKRNLIVGIAIIILAFAGYIIMPREAPTGNIILDTDIDQDIEVYFCPKDNCTQALLDLFDSAESEIYCAFFDLDLKEIANKIVEVNRKGINTKIIIDTDNEGLIRGEAVRYDNRSSYMHNKFCIIDKKTVSTGSMNPTERGAYYNNNNLIIINNRNLAKNYRNEFNEMWEGTFGKGDPTQNPDLGSIKSYFCPEDKCSEKIQDEIRKANRTIYFMTFSFTHEEIANDLIAQRINGVEIQGVFEKSQNSKYSQKERLDDYGIYTQFDMNKANMHHKVFIIDGETVITGSFNPSNNADKRNDENVLIIHDRDIAQKYLDEFSSVYG